MKIDTEYHFYMTGIIARAAGFSENGAMAGWL